jgi:hypothetical protein
MTRAYITIFTVILLEILILFLACMNHSSSPLTPDTGSGASITSRGHDGSADVERSTARPELWGYYKVAYDSQSRDLSVVPVRGTSYAFNVVNFLQPPMGSATSIGIDVLDDSQFQTSGRLDIRVMLHHPFPGQTFYNGFDVCGIFVTEGSLHSLYNYRLTYADYTQDPTLMNPDGYTRWMNPTEFLSGDVLGYEPGFWGTSESSENSGFVAGATLNPYRYFAHGLGPDDDVHEWLGIPGNIQDRGLFPSGASCSRDYHLHFPIINDKLVFVFNYAVLANWEAPSTNPPTDPVNDFPPGANAGWPLHLFITDNSNAYYTAEESGGTLSIDLEIFDWNALDNPDGVQGEIESFTLWSNEQLFSGGWASIMDTEADWNSGFIASTSVASIELPVSPGKAGDISVWVEVESTNPGYYDQGFGADVPDEPLAAYTEFTLNVLDCPKAGHGQIEGNSSTGSGQYLDNVVITGEDFVAGPSLGFWLEQIVADGGAGETEPYKIYATDVQYITDYSVSADFDLTDAPYGDYGLGCVNGCGTVTDPSENWNGEPVLMMRTQTPSGIHVVSNRTGPAPSPLEFLMLYWDPIVDAEIYRVYARFYDINGTLSGPQTLLATTTETEYAVSISSLPMGASGILELWSTSLPGLQPNKIGYESFPSTHAFIYMQDFENSLGAWQVRKEDFIKDWSFVRSTVECAYSGIWGLKSLQHPDQPVWTLFASPPIDVPEESTHVYMEFVHNLFDVNEENGGYQVGWLSTLPTDGQTYVDSWHPIPVDAYGYGYSDTDSLALREEFGCTVDDDNNFQDDSGNWIGWHLSGFDLSAMLTSDVNSHAAIGAAVVEYDHPEIAIDDVIIIVY